ncbi:pentatricopeptide repeat-containing protein At3g29230-like [Carica papaya]|uniref:pentatricopeptide repeat-containing protein At3g29230-like n=1 Tax=Carica papaya TaxID=3649 RepID=UPI000B8CC7D6|nr:pentatricopeptide repeat-containing protein At3g29230-like [Carica papaya]
MGFESDVSMANSLIDMYCKCGDLLYAHKLFDRMPVRDVASWTSMICGYCNMGKIKESVVLFERMKVEGFEPNKFTWNAMIAGYASRGDSKSALLLFNRMRGEGLVPDLVTWNAMISGFAQSQKAAEALEMFRDMLFSGIRPNQVTVTGLLPACGLTGAIHRGREIHGLIYRMSLDINAFIASALIDMYSKCGSMEAARNVFDLIPVKNIASWNAMIGCYGKHGMFDAAMELFERMKKEGIQPNQVTLASLLFTCSHSGEIEKGLRIFKSLQENYAVEVNKEHYGCVIDMLCRSGKMVEAYELVKEMPFRVTESIIGAFFHGCKIYGKRDLAKMMAEEILGMDLKKPGGFVTLSNIYAADGDWNEVQNVRNVMKKKNVNKSPGLSLVEKRNEGH